MKELSIEEKAKAYDEVRDKIALRFGANVAKEIFSQFEESKDERIRKYMIKYFEANKDELSKGFRWNGITVEECIAWLEKQGKNDMGISEDTKQKLEDNLNKALQKETPESCNEFLEKQGEQKPIVIIPKFRVGDEIKTSNEESLTITKIDEKGYWSEDLFICDFDEECLWDLVEQKPAWSEEDEETLGWLCTFLKEYGHEFYGGNEENVIDWLKSLKERVQSQPKQEWSERDKEEFHIAIETLAEAGQYDSAHWLQFLKDRYTWKPSNEQMGIIAQSVAVLKVSGYDELGDRLGDISEQLNRLRGE